MPVSSLTTSRLWKDRKEGVGVPAPENKRLPLGLDLPASRP